MLGNNNYQNIVTNNTFSNDYNGLVKTNCGRFVSISNNSKDPGLHILTKDGSK